MLSELKQNKQKRNKANNNKKKIRKQRLQKILNVFFSLWQRYFANCFQYWGENKINKMIPGLKQLSLMLIQLAVSAGRQLVPLLRSSIFMCNEKVWSVWKRKRRWFDNGSSASSVLCSAAHRFFQCLPPIDKSMFSQNQPYASST